MSHARTQIKDAMVSALQLGMSVTVQPGRIWTYQESELPIVGVYDGEEAQEQDDGTFDAIGRTLDLSCEIVLQAVDGNTADDALNALAAEIETVLGGERQVLGILDCVPVTWTTEASSEAETVTAKGLIGFEILYRTAIGAPDTII
jgi:hypothetical protein